MAQITGRYLGYTAVELAALKTKLQTAYDACLTAHQSYSRPGFSFNRVQFDSIRDELAEVNYAISLAVGTYASRTYADLSA